MRVRFRWRTIFRASIIVKLGTYRNFSAKSKPNFFFDDACTGETLGSLRVAGGEEEPVLEDRLPARPRVSVMIVGWYVLMANEGLTLRFLRFFFLLDSISSMRPKMLLVGGGGIQSRSFLRWPRLHLQPQALYAKSYPFLVHKF